MTFDPFTVPIAPDGLGAAWLAGLVVSVVAIAAVGAAIVSRSQSLIIRAGFVVLAGTATALATYGWVERTERLNTEHQAELRSWRTQVTDRIESTWALDIVGGDISGDWIGRNTDGRIVACTTHNDAVFTVTCDGIEPDRSTDNDNDNGSDNGSAGSSGT